MMGVGRSEPRRVQVQDVARLGSCFRPRSCGSRQKLVFEYPLPIAQVPPAFAAVKVDGRRAYARARSGEALELPARTVTIERLAIASWEPPGLRLLVVCSTGTYIRSLARDLGRAVGSAAHLGGLRRLAVGALTVDDALTVEALRGTPHAARLREADDRILPLADRFREEPAAALLASWGRSS